MKIVCLEGCSGTGKTTQYHLINRYYSERLLRILPVVEKDYEPFKTVASEWHKTKGPSTLLTREDIILFAKARTETFSNHFSQINGIDLILMDRYFYTSAVYQRNFGLDPKEILQININYGAPVPDLTFLFDCDPEICFERTTQRNKKTGGKSLFSTSPERIAEIREQYLYLVEGRKEVRIVNTNRPASEITSCLIYEIESTCSPILKKEL